MSAPSPLYDFRVLIKSGAISLQLVTAIYHTRYLQEEEFPPSNDHIHLETMKITFHAFRRIPRF